MKISVCLATFNGEKYLQQQIESILIQLGDNDELIISDDGSSDQTLNIIESFSDKRIHIFHNKMNHGFIGNFENALRIATGDYIFLSDQDDVWSSDKLRISLQALEKADLIVHDAEMIDGMGNSLGKNYITGHDYWIGMYALLKFRVRFIPERLVYYRRHGNNVSSSSEKSKNTWAYKIIIKRLGIIWALINK